MKSKISSFFEKNVGKLALSGIVFALALVVALTTAFVFNGKKLENKTTPPTNAETTIVPYNPDNWTDPGNYDTVNVATGDGFSGGDGSETDPYIISTARQLAGLAKLASTGGTTTYKYYKLGGNIDLLEHYWTPIGINFDYYFNGSFDGNGYVISGMVIDINSSSEVFAGLFGYMQGETGETLKISNLGIEKSEINVTTSSYIVCAGGLVGDSASSTSSSFSLTIENSYNTGSVSVESMDSYAYAGGFVGLSSSLTIDNSYNTGNINAEAPSSSACAGGLGGRFAGFSLTITNSYNTGTVDASGLAVYKGGIIGDIGSSGTRTINNFYFDGDVFTGNMVGDGDATITASGKVSGLSGLMKDTANYGVESFGTYTDDKSATGPAVWSSESPWNFESVWGEDVFGTNNGYPVLRTKEYNDMLPFLDKHWKYNAATSYAGGDGTQSSPYLISSAQELALLSNDVNSGKFYDQETGTDKYIYAQLTNDIDLSGKYWNPIGQLNVMDMSGYTFVGSFDGKDHEIMNLEYDTSSLGMFIGVFGFVGEKGPLMGGEFNENYTEIKNLGISGNDIELIFPSSSQIDGIGIAGITSYAIHTKIEDCYNKANITVDGAEGTVAGIVGAMSGEVKNCYNTGDLTMNILDISDVNSSYSANVGGVVGGGGLPSVNIDLISNCYNSGKLTAETSGYCMGFNINIGGISVGWVGYIKNSYNIGDMYGYSNASESTGTTTMIGGILAGAGDGEVGANIQDCFSVASISYTCLGGNNGINNLNSTAKGGIVGWKTASKNIRISNSYFDSSKFSGRLVGKADRNDSNNDGTYEDTYSIISSGKVSGLSEKMRDKANYGVSSFGTYTDDSSSTGSAIWSSENPWDFAKVWMIEQGFNFEYPIFQTMKARMWKYDDNVLAITGFAGGLGTAESPYQISSAEELAYLSNLANQGNTMTHKYYELTADIDLSGKYWTPIGVFSSKYFIGSFNGNNHAVKNMSIEFFSLIDSSADQISVGLFGLAGSFSGKAVYKDLKILNSKILVNCKPKNGFHVGAFIGFTGTNIEVNNIYVDGYISVETEKSVMAGGIIGNCQGRIQMNNLVSYADIDFQGSGTQCFVGGVIGACVNNSNATLNNLVNVGNINSTGSTASGGIIGNAYPTTLKLNKSFNVGSVHGNNYVGGLVGEMGSGNLSIEQCFNSGKVSTNNSSANVGGIAGNISGTATINNTFSTGDIQSPIGSGNYIKSFVGNGSASITNSYYKLDILNSSGGVASTQKNYYDKGSSDLVAFDGNIWFYHADLNEGLPLLRALFWAESTVVVQSDVYDKLVDYMAV